MSARAAGIPEPTHSSPPVPELIALSEVLPMMGIAFWCVWAAYTTTELPEVTVATIMSSEVAADAAEPPEVVALVAVFPEVMVPAAVSPKVAADAAEPPEAAVLSSVPCMVVAPSNAFSACHVTVEGTIAKLSAFVETSDGTAVEPLEVAASAAELPEVSVVSTYQLSACPVTAIEAVCEASFCPVTAMEAVCDLLPCSEPAMEACYELLSCPDPTEEATSELSALSVSPKDAGCEIPDCFAAPIGAICESPSLPVIAMEAVNEVYVCPVNPVTDKITTHELSVLFLQSCLILNHWSVPFQVMCLMNSLSTRR